MSDDSDICAICHEEKSDSVVLCAANHWIHYACFQQLKANNRSAKCVLRCGNDYVDPLESLAELLKVAMKFKNEKYTKLLMKEAGMARVLLENAAMQQGDSWTTIMEVLSEEYKISENEGNGLMSRAAKDAPVEVVVRLMQCGANANEVVNTRTPLEVALMGGRMEVADALLEHGADINFHDNHYSGVLHRAVIKKKESIVDYLLDKGADINLQTDSTRDAPLHCALNHSSVKIAKKLIDRGADIHLFSNRGNPLLFAINYTKKTIIKLLRQRGAALNAKNERNQTLLHLAAKNMKQETVEYLLSNGCDEKTRDNDGRTPFELALINGCHDNASVFVLRGATVPAPHLSSHFSYALINNPIAYVRALIANHRIDIHQRINGQLPLEIAALQSTKRLDMAKLLFELGADPNANARNGEPLLHSIIVWFQNSMFLSIFGVREQEDTVSMVKLFVENGVDATRRDTRGRTALRYAFEWKSKRTARVLYDYNSRLDGFTEAEKRTLLEYIAE